MTITITPPTWPGPVIADWDGYVTSLLPSAAAREPGTSYMVSLMSPLGDQMTWVDGLVAAMADIEAASGDVLDLLGRRVGELRGGLSDYEYRRIIAGRRVTLWSGSDPYRVGQGLAALTSTTEWRYWDIPGAVHVQSRIAWEPTDVWLRRAGVVMEDLIALGIEWDLYVYRLDVAVYGSPPPYGTGVYAYRVPPPP